MSLSKSTALSFVGQKSVVIGPEHHLQKMSSHELMTTHKKHNSGSQEEKHLANKDSPD